MLVPMIAFDLSLLIPGAERVSSALLLKSWGVALHISTPAAVADRARLEAVYARLPQPVFTDDEIFAQPWHATGNRYPTVLIDHVFYDVARGRGLTGRGFEGLIADRYFGAIVVPASSTVVVTAIRAGYRVTATVPQEGGEPLRILTRAP